MDSDSDIRGQGHSGRESVEVSGPLLIALLRLLLTISAQTPLWGGFVWAVPCSRSHTRTHEHMLMLTDFCSYSVVLAFRLQQQGTSSRKSALLTLVGREVQRGKLKTATPPCSPPPDPAQLVLATAPTTQHERGSWGLRLHSAPSLTPYNLRLQFDFYWGDTSFCR